MHLSAHHNVGPEEPQVLNRQWPMELDPRSVPARAVLERRVIHVHDVLTEADEYPTFATSTAAGHPHDAYSADDKGRAPHWRCRGLSRNSRSVLRQAIELVETFADQAVIAIENARLFEEVQARNRDLTALGEVGRAVGSTLDLKVVLKTIVERAVHLSGTDAGSMFYYRARGR